MKSCTATEFLRRWPAGLVPLTLPPDFPTLPTHTRQDLLEFGLPRRIVIDCYNRQEIDFSGTVVPLPQVWDLARRQGACLGEYPGDWSVFWHLGSLRYLQGSGWICIEAGTGRLLVVDMDLSDPVYMLAASPRDFYTVLAYMLSWSEQTGGEHDKILGLREALHRQQTIPVADLVPFWINIIDATLDGDPVRLCFSIDSRPGCP